MVCQDASMDLTTIAALVFAVVAGGVVAFQFALALGAPWGAYAMGGSFPGRFPPPLRVAAVVQGVVIGLLAVVVLSDAGVVLPDGRDDVPVAGLGPCCGISARRRAERDQSECG